MIKIDPKTESVDCSISAILDTIMPIANMGKLSMVFDVLHELFVRSHQGLVSESGISVVIASFLFSRARLKFWKTGSLTLRRIRTIN